MPLLATPTHGGTRKQIVGWGLALVATCLIYSNAYYTALSSHTRVGDFFQEWASARNYWEGIPIYTPQVVTAWRYLEYRPDYQNAIFVGINGHPPACVLAGLPFALIDYRHAFLLWNLLSIAAALLAACLTLRFEVGTLRTWYWLPLLTFLLSNAFMQNVMMGQLSIFLSLLMIGIAWADDRKRPATAGLLLGFATALKLFPGLLFLYFIIVRKWRVVFIGIATFAVLNLACLGLFGVQTFDHFVRYSMPEVMRYRDWWTNYSLTGWWFKLFDASSGQTIPFMSSLLTARIGSLLCAGGLVGLTTYAACRAAAVGSSQRSSLALFICAAVLATPVAWDHYFLLLLWPLTHLLLRMPAGRVSSNVVKLAAFAIWLNPLVLYVLTTVPKQAASPLAVLLVVSWPCYAVLAIYVLQLRQLLRETSAAAATKSVTDSATAKLQPAGGV